MNEENGIEYLKLLHNIFSELNITFWLIYGTCLGVYRDGALIPWDTDIDIGIWPQDNYELLVESLEKNFIKPECLFMDVKGVSTLWIIKVGDYHRTNNSIDPYLDITPFYEGNGSYWFLRGIKDGNVVGLRYPKIFFDSFEQIEFKGLTFNVPANTNEYLAYLYNDWRRSQKIEEYMLPNRVEAIVRLFEVYCEA